MNYFDVTDVERSYRHKFVHYRRNFIICPDQWETLAGLYNNLQWKEVKFDPAQSSTLPEVEGLYMFVTSPKKINAEFLNYLFYVGETDNIQRRFGNYLDKIDNPKSGQYKMYSIIDDFTEYLYFRYVEFPGMTQIDRRKIENEFLVGFLPPINSKYPQQLQSIVLAAYGH
jgi:hypothetical protein